LDRRISRIDGRGGARAVESGQRLAIALAGRCLGLLEQELGLFVGLGGEERVLGLVLPLGRLRLALLGRRAVV
jgi:hypothetical protein